MKPADVIASLGEKFPGDAHRIARLTHHLREIEESLAQCSSLGVQLELGTLVPTRGQTYPQVLRHKSGRTVVVANAAEGSAFGVDWSRP